MKLFNSTENRVKCGKCSTEFDLNKNENGCPLCGFGIKPFEEGQETLTPKKDGIVLKEIEFLSIPPSLNLKSGSVHTDDETQIWGSWLMFNDFFAPKFLCRVLAWDMYKRKKDSILLSELISHAISLIKEHRLAQLKGFPNLEKDRKGGRLVQHFLRTFVNMGLIEANVLKKKTNAIWTETWDVINISLTQQGLEFAQIKNSVFDEGNKEQILNQKEKYWLIEYLRKIDKQGYKEYSSLKEVYLFLKEKNNGNQDLWNWFETNEKYRKYILRRSERAQTDQEVFKKQLHNYARTFASAKISLLRELGVVKNKRNDYTIIGEF